MNIELLLEMEYSGDKDLFVSNLPICQPGDESLTLC